MCLITGHVGSVINSGTLWEGIVGMVCLINGHVGRYGVFN